MPSLLTCLYLYLWLVFLLGWFSFSVGFLIWLVFLFGWFSFSVGFLFWLVFLFHLVFLSVCLGEPKSVTCMLSPLGGAAEKPFPLPALVDIVKIKTSLNAKAGENVG